MIIIITALRRCQHPSAPPRAAAIYVEAIIEHIAYKIMLLLYYTDVKMHRSWWIDDRNEHRWERPSTLANGKHDILSHSWDSVADGGPTLTQRVLNVSCLLHGGGGAPISKENYN